MELLITFYGDAMAFFDKVNAESIGRAWGVLADHRQLVTSLFTLFIALYFLRVALGMTRGSVQDAAIAVLKAVLAYGLIISWPDFNDLAGDLLIKGPEEIGAAIASRMGGVDVANGMAGLVQNVALKAYNFAASVMQANESWVSPNLIGFLVMTVVLIGLVPLLLILTGVILFAKFITAIMLAIGPFAIVCYFFGQSRFVFDSWLRALAYGFFMIIFTFIILGLSFSFIDQVLGTISAGDLTNTGVFAKAVALALYLLLIVFFIAKTPAFAQTFAYGTAMNIGGMGGGGIAEVGSGAMQAARTLRAGGASAVAGAAMTGQGAVRGVRAAGQLSRQLTARLRGRRS